MKINNSFASNIIKKLDTSDYGISITDEHGIIIASSSNKKLNLHDQTAVSAIKNKKMVIEGKFGMNSPYNTAVALPLMLGVKVIGSVILEGEGENIQKVASIIKSSIETMIEYNIFRDESRRKIRQEEVLVNDILSRKSPAEADTISSYCRKLGFDLSLSRSIILIELEKKDNRYFNINLDLGYETSTENLKDELIKEIKQNRYLTNQDIVGFYGSSQIVIVKAFLTIPDVDKIYLALEKICHDILNDLNNNKIFSFYIAYGNIHRDFTQLIESYNEAREAIKIGRLINDRPGVFVINDMLLESVGYYLPSRIKDKMILPLINKLKKENGTVDLDLLYTVESFVDNCLSFSKTSSVLFLHRNTIAFRLEKFKKITGLDPLSSFSDAFLIKMAAVYTKLCELD